ncbi:hypothetical protein [Actinophytocola oryzae]|uniref:Secreted protein n=1 Tax=Actinophytocola oryzae TaxID=502181 RepID=A0A4R7W5D1_9PSEU|nr:hypothetical protein [Actinophytocola oryzae]TDV57298.1 hypothetical protein CLV71_101169 [Actinophytocola oryzae]
MSRISRVITTMFAVAVAVVGPTMVAAPAQADVAACTSYLEEMGYYADTETDAACAAGEEGDLQECTEGLHQAGVDWPYATRACHEARS